ncbi:MAG: peptide-methionine (R)-S-oxide reductase MsrB [Gammaproteobacteria bacterium]|nr:peptide-methionine (R)-S-oxide reductase MsrB [Gammaproteobacteria bacterium]
MNDKTDSQWREQLSNEQYRILRQQGTEPAFTGQYYHCTTPGIYICSGCSTPLFHSSHKYDSGSGWPSYWQPINDEAIETTEDHTHGMQRTEVHCKNCGGHMGHVFPDGPAPTGLRYCINSASLKLEEE